MSLRTGCRDQRWLMCSERAGQIEARAEIQVVRDGIKGRAVKFGQVAERSKAPGCKPVAPWGYGGSNPPLSTIRRASDRL